MNDSTPRACATAPAVTIRLPTTFATRIGGTRRVAMNAGSVGEALGRLTALHPALTPLIWLSEATLNPVIMVFHNETLIRDDLLDSALAEGDVIDVVPAVESG